MWLLMSKCPCRIRLPLHASILLCWISLEFYWVSLILWHSNSNCWLYLDIIFSCLINPAIVFVLLMPSKVHQNILWTSYIGTSRCLYKVLLFLFFTIITHHLICLFVNEINLRLNFRCVRAWVLDKVCLKSVHFYWCAYICDISDTTLQILMYTNCKPTFICDDCILQFTRD